MREISEAKESLAYQYNLEENPDIRAANAQSFFIGSQWEKCHALTSRSATLFVSHNPSDAFT